MEKGILITKNEIMTTDRQLQPKPNSPMQLHHIGLRKFFYYEGLHKDADMHRYVKHIPNQAV